jgi:hypothetical protein
LNDSVSVNIDTSVPEITDIWLVRDGQEQIYVHHSSDLSLMSIRFKSFDIQFMLFFSRVYLYPVTPFTF